MRESGRRRALGSLPSLLGVAVVALVAVAAGWAAGASLRVVHGTAEHGGGTVVALGGLPPWWTGNRVLATTVGTPVPTALNTTPSAPTVLPSANVTYLLNSGTSGAAGVAAGYLELPGPPAKTEVELAFTFAVTGGTAFLFKGYIETAAVGPTFPVLVRFLYVTGSVSLVPLTVTSVTVTSQLCSAVGSCP